MRNEELCGLRETARLLGVPPAWLYAQAIAGRLPAVRIGKAYRFVPKVVERALASRAARRSSPRNSAKRRARRAK
jgi:excisionase family DNA binding protein